jgi:hypothetical protein
MSSNAMNESDSRLEKSDGRVVVTSEVAEIDYGTECVSARQVAINDLIGLRVHTGVGEDETLRREYESLPDMHGRTRSIEVESTGATQAHIIAAHKNGQGFREYNFDGTKEELIVTVRSQDGEIVGEPVVAGSDSDGLRLTREFGNLLFDCDTRQKRA